MDDDYQLALFDEANFQHAEQHGFFHMGYYDHC